MIFLDYKTELDSNGQFTIELSDVTEGEIGLVSFSIPNINQRGKVTNCLDISCAEIDQSYENPKRLLKRLVFEELHDKQSINHWESSGLIQFRPISTFNKRLTFKVKRTYEETVPRFHRSVLNNSLLITFALRPINSETKWCA